MMMSFFSIFDPSTTIWFSFNWMMMLLPMFFFPMMYYLLSSKIFYLFKIFMLFTYNQFNPLLNKLNKYNLFMMSSLMFMIYTTNFMGLFPYIFINSSHIVYNLSFSLPLWLSIMFFSMLNTKKFLAHFLPKDCPLLLISFLIIVESISYIIRPFTLSIRLMANMIAGHILMMLCNSSISLNLISWISFPLNYLITILEFSIALIQSYVFTILLIMYSKDS